MGYDGVVAGTGLPELQDAVIQRAPALAQQPASGTASTPPASSPQPQSGSPAPAPTRAAYRGTLPPTQASASAPRVPASNININNTKQYSAALQVDNSSVIGDPVSAKKVIFVSDSEQHRVDNKTETETVQGKRQADGSGNGDASSTTSAAQGPG